MKDFTDITFILDRSGSMQSVESDVVGGYKKFVTDQKKVGDNAAMSLYQFDDRYEAVFENVPIKNVSPKLDFVPRGWTALNDAVGKTIQTVGERLAKLPEAERPDKVIMVIFTDGHENMSKEYSSDQIKKMVTHQQDTYNWKFIFLGAGINAFDASAAFGIPQAMAASTQHTNSGTRRAYNTISTYTAGLRTNRGGVTGQSLGSTYTLSTDDLDADINTMLNDVDKNKK